SAPESVWPHAASLPVQGELPPELQAALSLALDEILSHVPAASVAVVIPGQGIWADTRGIASTATGAAAEPKQMFQAASITKAFVAALVLQLEVEGALSLKDSVEQWFPSAPNAKLITIEHLLRHRTGLASFNALESLGPDYRSPQDSVGLAFEAGAQFCPGTQFAYSNTGYAMLGLILEAVEQKPLDQILAQRLFVPLGLKHTTLRRPGVPVPTVNGHDLQKAVVVQDDYATAYAAGSIASTAEDIVRFWHALLAGELVPKQRVHDMFVNMSPMSEARTSFYGLGVQLYDVSPGPGLMLGHSGGMPGFTSVVAYVAADDVFIAVLVNEKSVPAEAGLMTLLGALRKHRGGRGG
ncbi:MAG TPA: serine hydrolase domain-containing protein, partial [Polyangiaceae bacterium]|nr:serine hydrolase domain-containing protein [Polyangiaceae bacterium]